MTAQRQLNILMEEYCNLVNTDVKGKQKKLEKQYKTIAIISGIYGFLMSGIEPDRKYRHLFEGNNPELFYNNLICKS